jgi:hypothetical protein
MFSICKDDRKSLFQDLWIAGVVDAVKDISVPILWDIETRTTMVVARRVSSMQIGLPVRRVDCGGLKRGYLLRFVDRLLPC